MQNVRLLHLRMEKTKMAKKHSRRMVRSDRKTSKTSSSGYASITADLSESTTATIAQLRAAFHAPQSVITDVESMASKISALITTWPYLDLDRRTLNSLMRHGGSAIHSLETLLMILRRTWPDTSPKK